MDGARNKEAILSEELGDTTKFLIREKIKQYFKSVFSHLSLQFSDIQKKLFFFNLLHTSLQTRHGCFSNYCCNFTVSSLLQARKMKCVTIRLSPLKLISLTQPTAIITK